MTKTKIEDAAMDNFVEGAVTANHVSLHYWRSMPVVDGSRLPWQRQKPGPTLLLLHAAMESSACWAQTAEALHRQYEIIIPDARGHGFSQATETGYGVEDRANDVGGLIQALSLDRPVLIGHALGAETAIGTAALFPHLVRGVILEDPPWPGRNWGSTHEERSERALQWREEIISLKHQPVQAALSLAREQHPDWPETELLAWVEARRLVCPYLPNIIFAHRRRWSDYVRLAQCPILLLTGEIERGAVVNPQTAREAAAFWQNGRTVQVRGAGHHIRREQFKAYLRAVKNFLKRQHG